MQYIYRGVVWVDLADRRYEKSVKALANDQIIKRRAEPVRVLKVGNGIGHVIQRSNRDPTTLVSQISDR